MERDELDDLDPELDLDGPDASALAGLSEYSATGGGSWPPHEPRLHRAAPQREHVPDTASIEDLYRYSLARATEDDHSSFDVREDADDGPLHIDRHRA